MTILPELRAAILVIEDNSLLRTMYEMLLKRWGYAVRCTASTIQALATLDEFIPDAIVSDYSLGGTDTGVVAIQAVCERLGRTVPAIIVTGEYAIPAVGLPVLQKPVLPLQLQEAVRKMLCPPIAMAG